MKCSASRCAEMNYVFKPRAQNGKRKVVNVVCWFEISVSSKRNTFSDSDVLS